MNAVDATIDLLLAAGLLLLGLQVIAAATPFRSIVMFVVFGLLMALVWARLGAPDLALAEAAIGAGLTGAMLLLAYRRLLHLAPQYSRRSLLRRSWLAAAVGVLCALLVVALGVLLEELPPPAEAAGEAALAALPATGVGNPVTAVLILFRGYDTLLEMLVLLVAWLGIKVTQPLARPQAPHARAPMLDALLAAAIPTTLLIGGYLLHAGGHAPGGAFQAGAVLAAAGVLLALSGRLQTLHEPLPLQRLLLIAGIAVFAGFGLAGLASGQAPMTVAAGWPVYLIEGALTLSIALSLLLLFLGTAGVRLRR
jgi:multisubunit Na+/H+ antiporter MnhB subunit